MKARTSIVGTLVLLCSVVVAGPAAAAPGPFIGVNGAWGGWVWGDGWAGDSVAVSVYDAAGGLYSESTAAMEQPGGGTFGAQLGLDDTFGPGWQIVVSGDNGVKSLVVPALTVDRVDTAAQTVSGTADAGLDIFVQACVESGMGPSCNEIFLLDAGPDWTVGPLDFEDRFVRASSVDDDGDHFETSYRWPRLNYVRDVGISAQHRLEMGAFPPDAAMTVVVDGPDTGFDQTILAVTSANGDLGIDLAGPEMPIPVEDPRIVGEGWYFTAETVVDGWTMHKRLTMHGATVESVDQQLGSATGTCVGDFDLYVDLNRGELFDQSENHEGLCTDGTWTLTWDVDPFAVPNISVWGQEPDGDGFGEMAWRESISAHRDPGGLRLAFGEWDVVETTIVSVFDDLGVSVWSGPVNDYFEFDGLESEPGRVDVSLGQLFDTSQVVDGWTVRAESETQLKTLVFETVTIELDEEGLAVVNEFGEFSGTAPANRRVFVGFGPHNFHEVWSDDTGMWLAAVDLGENSEVQAFLPDFDGDANSIEAQVFFEEPEPEPPRLMTAPEGDMVQATGWPDPGAVMVWADGAEPMEVHEDEHGLMFFFDVDIVAGSFIEGTDGETTKTHVVYDLGVTAVEGSVVSGFGPSDRILGINIDTVAGSAFREFEPDEDGTFSVDFCEDWDWDMWGDGYLCDIVLGHLNLGAHDEDDDGTVFGIDPPWFEMRVDQDLVEAGVPFVLGGFVTSTAPGGGYEAQIDWGDGTTETVAITNDGFVYGRALLAADHVYEAGGIFPIGITVDLNGEMFEDGTQIVVFDPDGAFFTGSGRLLLPEGSYAGDPTASGKATFQLTSKYKKDGTLKGSVRFDFKAGDVEFRSTSLDVMIASPGFNVVAGQGTINGEGAFGFVVFVGDGDPDTFHLLVFGPGEDGEDEVVLIDTGWAPELVKGKIKIVDPGR